MLLNANFFDAVPARFLCQVAPIGQRHVFPLVAQDLVYFRGPGGCDPVCILIAGAARQTGHHHDAPDTEKSGQLECVSHNLIVGLSAFPGCQWVT